MAEQEQDQADEGTEKKSSKATPMLVAAIGIVGVLAGLFVVGPKLVGSSDAAVSEAEPEEEAEGGGHGAPAHGAAPAGGSLFEIENLLVNPAGSQGLRFLMVSVALELGDSQTRDGLSRREPQLRDLIISVLERQTLSMLSQVGARDSVRNEIRRVLLPVVGTSSLKVYLPQFVIN